MWLLYIIIFFVVLFFFLWLSNFLQDYIPKKINERKTLKIKKLITQRFKESNFFDISYDFSKYHELRFHDPKETKGETMFRCVDTRDDFPSTLFTPNKHVSTAKVPDLKLDKSSTSEELIEKKEEIKRPKPNRDWLELYVNKVESCITNTKEVDVSGFPELEARLRSVVEDLLGEGVPLQMIRDYLINVVNISPMTITKQYKIILNDYGNMEIKMGPLPKTVFFFYLRHPEGMTFTDLQDHRDEFINIYSHVTNFDDKQKIEDSIDRLINPLDNSISEKCSAVKTAFTRLLDDQVAKHYYISGNQGERKYIQINRELVNWETKF